MSLVFLDLVCGSVPGEARWPGVAKSYKSLMRPARLNAARQGFSAIRFSWCATLPDCRISHAENEAGAQGLWFHQAWVSLPSYLGTEPDWAQLEALAWLVSRWR